jgi:hypothetical protein
MIDCKFPFDENTEHDPDGPKLTPEHARFKRVRDMVSKVIWMTTVIEPPQYQDILALDATIRAEWMSPSDMNAHLDAQLGAFKRAVILAPYRAFGEFLMPRSAMPRGLDGGQCS